MTKKITWQEYFWLFVIGSLFGSLFESVYRFCFRIVVYHKVLWITNSSVIFGYFNLIYGFGFLGIALLFHKKNYKWYQYLIAGSLLGGLFEIIASYAEEIFAGVRSWNYSNDFLNILGRTTIPLMFIWGILVLIFIKFVLPKALKVIRHFKGKIYQIVTIVVLVFFIFNIFVTWSAAFRRNERAKGMEPRTKLGELYDKYFPEEYYQGKFYTAKIVGE